MTKVIKFASVITVRGCSTIKEFLYVKFQWRVFQDVGMSLLANDAYILMSCCGAGINIHIQDYSTPCTFGIYNIQYSTFMSKCFPQNEWCHAQWYEFTSDSAFWSTVRSFIIKHPNFIIFYPNIQRFKIFFNCK